MGHGSIEQIQPSIFFDGRAGETASIVFIFFIRIESNGQLLPMDQIITDRVAPMHLIPLRTVGIVLKKSVILPPEKYKSVWVVHPPLPWFKMI
jgi:hypothetical protein